MEPNYFYNFGYMTHSAFPEITFGFLCIVAAIVLLYRFVKKVKDDVRTKSLDSIPIGDIDKDRAMEFLNSDLRKKIQGVWRDELKTKEVNIYPWGNSFLMKEETCDGSQETKYYVFSPSVTDKCKFLAEAEETLTFLYNENRDYLFYADKGVVLERVSDWELRVEETMKKALDKVIK